MYICMSADECISEYNLTVRALGYDLASDQATWASCSGGDRIYARNAELFQRPKVLMVESSIPTLAAAVAAPILKLWPAKSWSGSPISCRTVLMCFVKSGLVRG